MILDNSRIRRQLDAVKQSSLLMLLCLTALVFVINTAFAQTEVEETTSGGWELTKENTLADASAQASEEVTEEVTEEVAEEVAEIELASAKQDQKNTEQANGEEPAKPLGLSPDGLPPAPVDTLVITPPMPVIPSRPSLNIDEDLRIQLETQFEQLQALRDTEDAFSERLGETYFSYGDALQRAGRLEEARDMFAQALHLLKINNGVNHIAQRPVLRSLAVLEFAKGDIEKAEEYVKRMIWVEKQERGIRDTYSYDVVVRLGNEYLNQFLYRPVAGENSITMLNKASNYFSYAIRRYGNQPIDKLLMPYGELAYTQHLKLGLSERVDSAFYRAPTRSGVQPRIGDFGSFDRRAAPQPRFSRRASLGSGERYMREYLSKAARSGDVEHTVKALLNIGDVHQLFGRSQYAANFYRQAWEQAQFLDENHELVVGMSRPHKLPAFFFASDRNNDEVATFTPKVNIPVDVSVDSFGQVKKVLTDPKTSDTPKFTSRASRQIKRVTFRPAIEGGKLVGTDLHTESVRVTVRKGESTTSSSASSGN